MSTTTIKIKRRTADGNDPTTLEEGELAYNTVSKKLFCGIAGGGGVFELGPDSTQTLTNKTLTAPTIGDFTNATHDHTNAAGGGTVDHADLTTIGTNTHAQIDTHLAALAAHGATGAVVGTTNTQTLTNKTLDTPTIEGGNPAVIVQKDEGSNDNVHYETRLYSTETTNNSYTSLMNERPMALNSNGGVIILRADVNGHRTDSGNKNAVYSKSYTRTYRQQSGGGLDKWWAAHNTSDPGEVVHFEGESGTTTNWDSRIILYLGNILFQVRGDTGATVKWHARLTLQYHGS